MYILWVSRLHSPQLLKGLSQRSACGHLGFPLDGDLPGGGIHGFSICFLSTHQDAGMLLQRCLKWLCVAWKKNAWAVIYQNFYQLILFCPVPKPPSQCLKSSTTAPLRYFPLIPYTSNKPALGLTGSELQWTFNLHKHTWSTHLRGYVNSKDSNS